MYLIGSIAACLFGVFLLLGAFVDILEKSKTSDIANNILFIIIGIALINYGYRLYKKHKNKHDEPIDKI